MLEAVRMDVDVRLLHRNHPKTIDTAKTIQMNDGLPTVRYVPGTEAANEIMTSIAHAMYTAGIPNVIPIGSKMNDMKRPRMDDVTEHTTIGATTIEHNHPVVDMVPKWCISIGVDTLQATTPHAVDFLRIVTRMDRIRPSSVNREPGSLFSKSEDRNMSDATTVNESWKPAFVTSMGLNSRITTAEKPRIDDRDHSLKQDIPIEVIMMISPARMAGVLASIENNATSVVTQSVIILTPDENPLVART